MYYLSQSFSSLTTNIYLGDNVDVAIWSTLEISFATICACLPAIHALLCRRFPSLFDASDLSSCLDPSRKLSSEVSQDKNSKFSMFPRFQGCELFKLRPLCKKGIVLSDDELLERATPKKKTFRDKGIYGKDQLTRPHKEARETKVWVNPKFDTEGNMVEWQSAIVERQIIQDAMEAEVDCDLGGVVGEASWC
jgi:hypothetical protein